MKYLVIGIGGTGGAIAAYLTKAGIDTTLIARGKNLSALRENGITLSLDNNEYTNAVKAFDMNGFENAAKSGAALSPDVIFVCVKGYSITDTIPFIKSVSKPETVVIPILNIYGTGRHMQKELPSLTVTDGCIYVSSSLVSPGKIHMYGSIFRIVYGLPSHKKDDSRLIKIESDLKLANITPVFSDNVEKDTLQKFSYVSPMAGCGLYFGANAAEMQKPGAERELFSELISEIETLAAAMGIKYEKSLVKINLDILDALSPDASTSMQRDIAAGKQSEIDGLIYEVVRLADKYGLSLPAYRKISEKFRIDGLK